VSSAIGYALPVLISSVAINFVSTEDVRILMDISQYYSVREYIPLCPILALTRIEIDEMPMNVS